MIPTIPPFGLLNFNPAHPADHPAVVRLQDEPGSGDAPTTITQAVFTREGAKLVWFREDAPPRSVALTPTEMATLCAAWQEYSDAWDDWNARKAERENQAIEEARTLAASLVFLGTKTEEDYQIQIWQDKGSELWGVTVPALTLLLNGLSDFYVVNLLPEELPGAVRTMLAAIEEQVKHWESMPLVLSAKPGVLRFCEAYREAYRRAQALAELRDAWGKDDNDDNDDNEGA